MPFFKEKLLVQWNDPTLTCFMENRSFMPEPDIPAIREIMSDEGKYYGMAVELMNQYQLLIYLGYCFTVFRHSGAGSLFISCCRLSWYLGDVFLR